MTRYQSIISAIISAACVFLVPWLNRKGIIVDETAITTVIAGIIAAAAFIWTAWKNHNITEAAMEAQCILNEFKTGDEDLEEELESEVHEEEDEEDEEVAEEE